MRNPEFKLFLLTDNTPVSQGYLIIIWVMSIVVLVHFCFFYRGAWFMWGTTCVS
jgi:hypothetical protein